jgi:L-ascorbate metabolism protein UlaG (beta-lactamase superfamily)
MVDEIRLQFLSNSGFLLTTEEEKRVIIDPYLTGNALAPFGPEKVPSVDLVLASHVAPDHLGDSFLLARRDGVPLFCDIVSRQLALAAGLAKEQIKSGIYGASPKVNVIDLRIVEARHASSAMDASGHLMTGYPLAFLITTPRGLRIYHAGDTSLFSDMQLIGRLYRPHIGLFPVGSAAPGMGIDMLPGEAAQAAQWVGCELAVPMHYWDAKHPAEFTAAVKALTPWMEVRTMAPGEELVLSIIKQGVRATFIHKNS